MRRRHSRIAAVLAALAAGGPGRFRLEAVGRGNDWHARCPEPRRGSNPGDPADDPRRAAQAGRQRGRRSRRRRRGASPRQWQQDRRQWLPRPGASAGSGGAVTRSSGSPPWERGDRYGRCGDCHHAGERLPHIITIADHLGTSRHSYQRLARLTVIAHHPGGPRHSHQRVARRAFRRVSHPAGDPDERRRNARRRGRRWPSRRLGRARPAATGIDRLTVTMVTVAAFLAVLAFLAWQVRATATGHAGRLIVVRRIYQTRVVETLVGPSKSAFGDASRCPALQRRPAPSQWPRPVPLRRCPSHDCRTRLHVSRDGQRRATADRTGAPATRTAAPGRRR